jgi:hypothetical protein
VGSEDFGAAWVHQGVSYFILGGSLIEARSGQVRWTVPKESIQGCGPAAVYGDILVTYGHYLSSRTDPEGKHGMTAYRITPDKCTEIWTSPGFFGHGAQYGSVIIHRGRAIGESTHLKAGGPKIGNKGVGVAFDLEKGPADLLAAKDRFETSYGGTLAAEGRLIGRTMWNLDPAKFGESMGTFKMAECTGPAYAGGCIYFRTPESAIGGAAAAAAKATDDDEEVEAARGVYRLVCYDLRAE